MTAFTDYRFRAVDLAQALRSLDGLRQFGILPPDGLPQNMLGDPIDGPDGTPIAFGRLADGFWYFHIRSEVSPDALPVGFNPAAYGLEPVSADVCAAVLGVWA